jgi:hypothetical protein
MQIKKNRLAMKLLLPPTASFNKKFLEAEWGRMLLLKLFKKYQSSGKVIGILAIIG